MNPWAHVLAAREPRPQLLGSEIEPYPYISAYGLLVRVSRLMALEPSEWFQTLGIRCSTAPLRDLRIGRVARDRFEAAMGLAGTQVTTWWQEEIWSPLQTDGILDRIMRPIRTCLKCAEHGYHTSLFQLPSIYACPWHGCSLTDRCRRCDKPATTHIDEDGRLGRCSCGLDSFNVNQATIGMKSFPTAEAERCLQSYLDWSAEQRKKRWFIGSERSDCWLVGFAQLAQPPPMLSALSGWKVDSNTRLTRFESSPEPDPDAANFWGWGALADERPLTFVPLPPGTQARLMEVTQRVVGGFPSDTSTPLQLVARNGFDEQATLLENAAQNPGCFIALHGQATDGSSWLRMSAVDLETLQLCGKLLDCVLVASDAEPVDGDYSRQTARTQRLSCVAGRRHLAHALERMLLQGYAQGLEALLRASLGQPPPAEWWQPAAEVVAGPGTLERIVTCWVRTAAPEVRRAVCPQPTPIASGRKKRRATRDRMVDQRRNRKKKFA